MENEPQLQEDSTLAAVRTRGLQYLNYLFWALTAVGSLLVLQLCASLMERWLGLLGQVRRAFGFVPPVNGPDLWLLSGFAVSFLVAATVIMAGLRAYRSAWNARLSQVWEAGYGSVHARIRPLTAVAHESEIAFATGYLEALAGSPVWRHLAIPGGTCQERAAAILKALELDIAHRAVTAGLVVGMNRNSMVDAASIIGAALELQFHVLTRLGKRPSMRTWVEMFKRTTASLFLNWYVSREDALYLKLAIKKTAWGMGAASDLAQQTAEALEDFDWDHLSGSVGVPGLSLFGSLAAKGLGIGAFGLRHIGSFIESTADDLLQGVLAGGILYYHGMALAAECLAIDQNHRASADMNRTVSQAMLVACAPAARILQNQVRMLRDLLRQRRRLAFGAAKAKVKHSAGSAVQGARSASASLWSSLKPRGKPEE